MNNSLKIGVLIPFFILLIFSMAFAEEFRYDSKGKRDPFLSPLQAASMRSHLGPGDLRLEGIIFDPGKSSYALVNGEIVREGQKFSGYLLKKIDANQVVFQKEDDVLVIPLREDENPKSKTSEASR